MTVIDTNVLSEEMKIAPNPAVLAWFAKQSPGNLFTTAVCEAEIRLGLKLLPDGQRKRDLEAAANRILALFAGRIVPFDSAAATTYALIVSHRRSIGRPINDFDAQIAAIARSRRLALATRNLVDFEDTGVELVNPWA